MTIDLHIDAWLVVTELLVPLLGVAISGLAALSTFAVAVIAVGISLQSHRLNVSIRQESEKSEKRNRREQLATKLFEYMAEIRGALLTPKGGAVASDAYPALVQMAIAAGDPTYMQIVDHWREIELDADAIDPKTDDMMPVLVRIGDAWLRTSAWVGNGAFQINKTTA